LGAVVIVEGDDWIIIVIVRTLSHAAIGGYKKIKIERALEAVS
jgi:hypothetical protein